uniref:Uncharacterized protein n=1 Tax=Caenorhabditis japonica TaxID=281687 RepID=A0A8R1E174_CAEJA
MVNSVYGILGRPVNVLRRQNSFVELPDLDGVLEGVKQSTTPESTRDVWKCKKTSVHNKTRLLRRQKKFVKLHLHKRKMSVKRTAISAKQSTR